MAAGDWIRFTAGFDSKGFEGILDGRAFKLVAGIRDNHGTYEGFWANLATTPGEEAEAVGMRTFLMHLFANRESPVASRALEAVREGFLPAGYDVLVEIHPDLERNHETFYLTTRGRRDSRIAFAMRHPSLSLVLRHVLGEIHGRNPEPPLTDGKALLARYRPEATPGSIRSVLRLPWPVLDWTVLDALLGLPPERHPGSPEEWVAFREVVEATFPYSELIGGYGHLAAARQGWTSYADMLLRRVGRDLPPVDWGSIHPLIDHLPCEALRSPCSDVRDMAKAFSNQVLMPVLLAGDAADEGTILELCGHGDKEWSYQDLPMHRVAATLLFGAKSLPAVLEASGAWHAHQRAMEAAIGAIAVADPDSGKPASGTWPLPFAPVTAPNGVEIAFLGSKDELRAEGSHESLDGSPGLNHCVAGYANECAAGILAIASLRIRGDTGIARLSTAEVRFTGQDVRIAQHRGGSNAEPSSAAKAALEWFAGEVEGKRLLPDPDYLSPDWRRSTAPSVARFCGYDPLVPGAIESATVVWSRFLTRPLREPGAILAAGATLLPKPEGEAPGWTERTVTRMRRLRARAFDRFFHVTLSPLWLGDRIADRLENVAPRLNRDHVAIGSAILVEAALLWALDALWGNAWWVVLLVQIAVPAGSLALDALRTVPRIGRTLSNRRWASRLNGTLHGEMRGSVDLAAATLRDA
jgi:hypothetical protein